MFSQQVKRVLSHDCILVRFSWFRPEQTVWCEKEPKQLKIATMYNFLPLVRTKASELSDFLGVNTRLEWSTDLDWSISDKILVT